MSIHELCSLEAKIGIEKALDQKMHTNRLQFVHADAVIDKISLFTDSPVGSTDSSSETNLAMRTISNTDQFGRVDNEMYSTSKATKNARVTDQMKTTANDMLGTLYLAMKEKEVYDMQV